MRLTVILALTVLLTVATVCSGHDEYRSSYRGPIYRRRYTRSHLKRHYDYARRYCYNRRRVRTTTTTAATPRVSTTTAASGSSSGSLPTSGRCLNQLADANGSYIGRFNCPYLEDEDPTWTRCCGYSTEQFCCEEEFDDSWAHEFFSLAAPIAAAVAALLALVAVIVTACVVCRAKKKARVMSEVNLKKSPSPANPSLSTIADAGPLPSKMPPAEERPVTPGRQPPRYADEFGHQETPIDGAPPPYPVYKI